MSRILLVANDSRLVSELCHQIRRVGHEVRVAFDGSEGYLSAVGESPDAIVLDANLGGFDGLQVARLLRSSRDTARIPILALATPDDPVARLADDFIHHRLSPRSIARRVDRLIRDRAPIAV